jgi:hypothetical protein
MSKKNTWAEMDIRIRGRRAVWTQDERQDLDESLKKLPDVADKCEHVQLPQPAVSGGGARAAASN